MTLPEEIKTENDLVAAVGLMFFDSMSVKCDASSYARYVIDLVRAFDADLVAALGAPVAPATAVEAMRAKCEAIALRLATHPDPTWARAAGLVANEIRALTPSDRSERAAPAEPFPGSPDEGLRANQCDASCNAAADEHERLTAENERLQKALTNLVDVFDESDKFGPRPDIVELMLRRARAALSEEPSERAIPASENIPTTDEDFAEVGKPAPAVALGPYTFNAEAAPEIMIAPDQLVSESYRMVSESYRNRARLAVENIGRARESSEPPWPASENIPTPLSIRPAPDPDDGA